MAVASRKPILVTGSTRSGTTWTGSMLCLSGEAGYITEPFNRNYQPGWIVERLPHQSLYINGDNARLYRPVVDQVMRMRYPIFRNLTQVRSARQIGRVARDYGRSVSHRIRKVRPLIKDPYALFSAEWLAATYGMDVVITIRHPAGFVSSIKKLNWKRDFRHWAEQDLLLRDLLSKYADRIHDYARRGDEVDIIDRAILMWNAYYRVVEGFRREHPDWSFVRYDDLAEEPIAGFRSLYAALGLTWSPETEEGIAKHSDAGNVKDVSGSQSPHTIKRSSRAAKWTWADRLSAEEIARVRQGTAEVAAHFFDDSDWNPPEH